jgi:hypothetical protein
MEVNKPEALINQALNLHENKGGFSLEEKP